MKALVLVQGRWLLRSIQCRLCKVTGKVRARVKGKNNLGIVMATHNNLTHRNTRRRRNNLSNNNKDERLIILLHSGLDKRVETIEDGDKKDSRLILRLRGSRVNMEEQEEGSLG